MSNQLNSLPVSDATVIPRVGVAVLLVDHREYVLIGKRIGSHGHGTLALPGGHLDHNETFEQCAARELLEETGISISDNTSTVFPNQDLRSHAIESEMQLQSNLSEIRYLTTIQSPNMTDGGVDEKPKHYITIVMKASVFPVEGEDEVVAEVREPNKCLGWLWVPMSYLESVAASQSSLKRLRDAAEREGHALPVSLEKLLEAQRLAEAMRSSGEFKTFGREKVDGNEATGQQEPSSITSFSVSRDQESRRPALEIAASSTSTNTQEVASPLALPSNIESALKISTESNKAEKPAPTTTMISTGVDEEDDDGPLPEAIQNLHAGRPRKSTSHSRSTSLSFNQFGTPASPLRTSYAHFHSSNHHLADQGPPSTSSSPILNRSSLPRSPFLYHQDLNSPHHHHVARSPSSSSSNASCNHSSHIQSPRESMLHQQHQQRSICPLSNSRGGTGVIELPPKPRNEEEETVWNIADDFTQGAPLFEPLRKLVESGILFLTEK